MSTGLLFKPDTKLLVCGGRDFDERDYLFRVLDDFHQQHVISQIIHGGARGADSLAGKWADANAIDVRVFPITNSDWRTLGKKAGSLRNQKMLDEGKPTNALAFPGGSGTKDMKDMMKRLHRRHVPTIIVPEPDTGHSPRVLFYKQHKGL